MSASRVLEEHTIAVLRDIGVIVDTDVLNNAYASVSANLLLMLCSVKSRMFGSVPVIVVVDPPVGRKQTYYLLPVSGIFLSMTDADEKLDAMKPEEMRKFVEKHKQELIKIGTEE